MELLKWFLGLIILLWFVWFFTGGPDRYEKQHPGPYINPPAPLNDGNTYGNPNTGYKDYFTK